jgi:tRNA dimethylallyltransferase
MEVSLDRIGGARAVLLAGPTASGKSAAALDLADASARAGRPAVIVNADSMQVYGALRILTARPAAADEARAVHRLYGHAPADRAYSVGAWLADIAPVLDEADARGALPIVVGGTGLYFKALTEGLAELPPIPAEMREHWRRRLRNEGPAALHAELHLRDAASAAAIRPSDPQRILRALEVLEATGATLPEWQRKHRALPLLRPEESARFVLDPDRGDLYRRIESRLDDMLEAGALAEVEALLSQGLQADLPVMKATGVREFAAHLRDGLSLAEAVSRAKQETRRYAKRQFTWLRHQMADWPRIRS